VIFVLLYADCNSKDFLALVQSYGFAKAGLDVRGLTDSQVILPFWPHKSFLFAVITVCGLSNRQRKR
jgi:hypothetical protein